MLSMAQQENIADFDYSFVDAIARVALYDDLRSAPRITKISPAPTNEFIENLASTVYEQAKLAGGNVPYTLVREVSENFIHAQFQEIVVSILDGGNTIRFADQGPGIQEKEKAQEPGFSSAVEPMKQYIRGVGSGFPIVRDYLDSKDGSIVIEDNLVSGAVVTISLEHQPAGGKTAPVGPREGRPIKILSPIPLGEREKEFLVLLMREGELGITELSKLTGYASSTTYNTLKKLEESGLAEKRGGRKRWLTDLGYQVAVELK